ncbi:GTPase domain-containing protein [Legionella fallonii]|uniref:Rho GTPase (Miro-like) n=1 Tax=Legionella fallonii LLAP-10 TaxID=1212491 RepID=A0A098G4G8_9GAMM|nr:GTPase domain-containing protein [Legionella fallonii]CEG57388.1 protein of unknown function [Miro-like domain] [Legionella fallonii LLAP-10]
MKKLKAYIFGHNKIGKSELVKKLHTTEYITPSEQEYIPTTEAHHSHMMIHSGENEEPTQIELYDMSGSARSAALSNIFSAKFDYGIYCIDLSEILSEFQVKEIKKDIGQFQNTNPHAKLILVGTKSDIAFPNALNNICKQLADIKFQATVTTNTKTIDGAKELYDVLKAESRKKTLPNKDDLRNFFNVVNPIIKARNRCVEDSSLYAALNNLHEQAKDLPFNLIESLGQEAHVLLNHLEDPAITDKMASINAFVEHGHQLIRGEHNEIKSAILSVAITALVTVVAALIGFGIGFALGLWAGPGAFFTALAAGCFNAVAVTGGASAIGLCTLVYTSLTFFRAPPVLQAVTEVALQAQEEIPVLNSSLEP